MAAGATVTGVSPVAVGVLAGQLMDSEASVSAAAPELNGGRARRRRGGACARWSRSATWRRRPTAGWQPRRLDPATAVALLPYSSGTTGLPKGVMLTHENLVVGVAQACAGLKLGPRDTVVAVAPFAHVMGFVITLSSALASGAAVVTLPQLRVRVLPRPRRAPPGHPGLHCGAARAGCPRVSSSGRRRRRLARSSSSSARSADPGGDRARGGRSACPAPSASATG